MAGSVIDVDLYLQRIGVAGRLPANATTLAHLQRQHLLHIPFENLDIRAGIPIPLDPAAFFEKIVERSRGGYCYECNGLFHLLLTALGFNSRMISCRFRHGQQVGPEFDHMALIVTTEDGEWLVDVGFGDFSMRPLLLQPGLHQRDGRELYSFLPYREPDGREFLAACKWHRGKSNFITKYIFTTEGTQLEEFCARHVYQQSSPDSHFTKNTICSRATEGGRVSLINNRLIETRGGIKQETHLVSEEEKRLVLERHFGIWAEQVEERILRSA